MLRCPVCSRPLRENERACSLHSSRSEYLSGLVVGGKYRIASLLGEGGMGVVFRATQLQLERSVALKVMRGEYANDPKRTERFKREALAIARVRHPNAVAVYDFGVSAEVGAYFVMELLEGRSLREALVADGRLRVESALELMSSVCAAVEAAHAAGVIHRDLKPANIFLERLADGTTTAKVLDFGIAKLVAAPELGPMSLTADGAAIGTPLYMSPEQCDGLLVDARSDVYSLGCLGYELVTGRPPFRGATEASIFVKHLTEAPKPPSTLNPAIPHGLDEALLRALEKLPGQRYQSAAELAAALASVRRGAHRGTESPTGAPPLPSAIAVRLGSPPVGEPPTNLPRLGTTLVGRDREVHEIDGLLATTRLVTLTGVGGCGKTRLAIHYAERFLDRLEGSAWFVDLAGVASGELVASAMAFAIGVPEDPTTRHLDAIVRTLSPGNALVLVDNCEHLLEARATTIGELLRACPRVRVIATSRSPLGIGGEAVFPVPALDIPDERTSLAPEDVERIESVRLFVERARLRLPDFSVTSANVESLVRVARRLEGIPLAIELAAARTRVLSVEQIEMRLADRFRLLRDGGRAVSSRQRALQATLDWSHELLSDEERELFRRLSVFAGGWTLDAAFGVVGPLSAVSPATPARQPYFEQRTADSGQLTADVVDILARLVDKSLVVVDEKPAGVRYRMLEMVREYAALRLNEAGEEPSVRRAHLAYFADLGKQAGLGLVGHDQDVWLRRLQEEDENIRAALAASLADPNALEIGLELGSSIWLGWQVRGQFRAPLAWFGEALGRADGVSTRVLTRALTSAANLASGSGDLVRGRDLSSRALELATAAGDSGGAAAALNCLGILCDKQGDFGEALRHYERGLDLGRPTGDAFLVANLLNNYAGCLYFQGDLDGATRELEECLLYRRRTQDRWGLARALSNLAEIVLERGDARSARRLLVEAFGVQSSAGDLVSIAYTLEALARCAEVEGQYDDVPRLFGSSEAIRDAIGAPSSAEERATNQESLTRARDALGRDAFDRVADEARALGLAGIQVIADRLA